MLIVQNNIYKSPLWCKSWIVQLCYSHHRMAWWGRGENLWRGLPSKYWYFSKKKGVNAHCWTFDGSSIDLKRFYAMWWHHGKEFAVRHCFRESLEKRFCFVVVLLANPVSASLAPCGCGGGWQYQQQRLSRLSASWILKYWFRNHLEQHFSRHGICRRHHGSYSHEDAPVSLCVPRHNPACPIRAPSPHWTLLMMK